MRARSIVILGALALCMACEGRSTDTGDNGVVPDSSIDGSTDAKQDGNPFDFGGDGALPDGWTPDGYVPTGSFIEEAQGSSDSLNCTASGIANFATALTGEAVVVSPKFVASKGKLDGYFISTTGLQKATPLNGVELTVDVALATDFKIGDVLAVTADHVEYYCMTELKATAVQVTGTGPVPLPLTVSPADLDNKSATKAQTAEPLEGVLVRMSNVTVSNASVPGSDGKDHGMFEVEGKVVVDTWAFDVTYGDARLAGDVFDEIVGIVVYSYGQYVVQPRSDADLTLKGDLVEPTTDVPVEGGEVVDVPPEGVTDVPAEETTPTGSVIEQIQKSAESQTCANPSGFGNYTTGLALEGVVVTPKFTLSSGKLDGYFIATKGLQEAQTWNGILMAVDVALATNFAAGDVVSLTGAQHTEAYCESELKPTAVAKTATAQPPEPLVADPSVLASATLGEPYEGVLVQIQNVEVTNANPDAPAEHYNMQVTGGLLVKKPYGLTPVPAVGDKFASITGVLRYGYGAFYLYVPDKADMVPGGTTEPTPEVTEVVDVIEPTPEFAEDVVVDLPPETTDTPADGTADTMTMFQIQNTDASKNCATPDGMPIITTGLSIGPVVVTSPAVPTAGKSAYFVADPVSTWPIGGTGAWTGGLILVPTSPAFAVGDVLTATVDHEEYYCMTELISTSVTKTGTGEVPPAKVLDPAWLGNGGAAHLADLEAWEGFVVELTGLKVTATTPADTYSWFEAGTADGTVTGIQVMKNSTITYTPTVGATIAALTAPLQYHHGKFRFKVRTIDDLQ
jgi:hypothetical protein